MLPLKKHVDSHVGVSTSVLEILWIYVLIYSIHINGLCLQWAICGWKVELNYWGLHPSAIRKGQYHGLINAYHGTVSQLYMYLLLVLHLNLIHPLHHTRVWGWNAVLGSQNDIERGGGIEKGESKKKSVLSSVTGWPSSINPNGQICNFMPPLFEWKCATCVTLELAL